MSLILKSSFCALVLSLFSIGAMAQTASTFSCEKFEYMTEDPKNPVWVPHEQINRVELKSTMTPLWDGVIYAIDGSVIGSGPVSGVGYYSDLSELDVDLVDLSAAVLGVPKNELHSYQLYPIVKDQGDGTGFSILEFFKLNKQNSALEPIGSVFFYGWGSGRCQN